MANYLAIADLQIPFEAPSALNFISYVQRHFKIPLENMLCVGDEVDEIKGSMHAQDPDGLYTANQEIKISREKLREWHSRFPYMRICTSNHGQRWARKASAAEIPSQMIRAYQDVLEIPPGWRYADKWVIPEKHPFVMTHGLSWGGKTPYRLAAEVSAMSQLFGHLHSSAGFCRVKTNDKDIWGCNVGSLIDEEAYAFKYGRDHRFKANNGAAIIFNNGKDVMLISYES